MEHIILDQSPARLVLDNVRPGDAGGYRCRVDFYRAPTTIASLVLDVIGNPNSCTQSKLLLAVGIAVN